MADIFVAHVEDDIAIATRVGNELQRAGWDASLLMLPLDVDGVVLPDLEAAASAGCLIAIWSNASFGSALLQELAASSAERACLVSVLRNRVQAPEFAARLPVIDMSSWHADISIAGAFDDVIAAVQHIRGETVQMSASPELQQSAPPDPQQPAAPDVQQTAPLQSGDATALLGDVKVEEADWNRISESEDIWDFEAFLEKYPNGYYAEAARARMDALRAGASGGHTGLMLVGAAAIVFIVAAGIAIYALFDTGGRGGKSPVVAGGAPATEPPNPAVLRPDRKPAKPALRPPPGGAGPSAEPEPSGGPSTGRGPSVRPDAEPRRSAGAQASACDRLAASGFDAKRKSAGVALRSIQVRDAIAACREATRRFPDEPRYQYQLGRAFYADKRYDDAIPLFRRAAERGYPVAMYRLGKMYQRGIGLTRDDAISVSWYRRGADAGNAAAMNDLAWMYERGRGVTKDLKMAARWYLKAAQSGMRLAMYNTGLFYANGRGVAKDDREAARWYRKAAEKGHVKAMYYLGRRYASGRGVDKDDNEAMRWYRRAAAKGYADALYSVGWMYEKGRSVNQDDVEAVRWYRKAAAKGDASAMNAMGRHYLSGKGVSKDASEALRWFRKAANKGLTVSMNNVGLAYDKGRGVPQDKAEAVRWYRKAAKAGHGPGMHNLAAMYDDGSGISKDPVQAAHWIFEALKKRNAFTIKQMKTKPHIWSKSFRRDLQRRLRAAGYYNGAIDGVFGDSVKAAIDNFVRSRS